MTGKRIAGRRSAAVLGLAGIRLFNGAVGLLAPTLLINRLDRDSEPDPAAIYAFRLFGIRTVLLGLDLLTNRGERLTEDLREGVLIHGSDTVTAGDPRTARPSAAPHRRPDHPDLRRNTALAVSALTGDREKT